MKSLHNTYLKAVKKKTALKCHVFILQFDQYIQTPIDQYDQITNTVLGQVHKHQQKRSKNNSRIVWS